MPISESDICLKRWDYATETEIKTLRVAKMISMTVLLFILTYFMNLYVRAQNLLLLHSKWKIV